jgi:hypothetical protein
LIIDLVVGELSIKFYVRSFIAFVCVVEERERRSVVFSVPCVKVSNFEFFESADCHSITFYLLMSEGSVGFVVFSLCLVVVFGRSRSEQLLCCIRVEWSREGAGTADSNRALSACSMMFLRVCMCLLHSAAYQRSQTTTTGPSWLLLCKAIGVLLIVLYWSGEVLSPTDFLLLIRFFVDNSNMCETFYISSFYFAIF